jgi:hypothetical protein
MKKTILSALLVSVTLVAGDAASVYKSGVLLPADGSAIYKKSVPLVMAIMAKKLLLRDRLQLQVWIQLN